MLVQYICNKSSVGTVRITHRAHVYVTYDRTGQLAGIEECLAEGGGIDSKSVQNLLINLTFLHKFS